jgi:hypothetical protein
MTATNEEPLVTIVPLANRLDDPTCAVYPERSRGVHRGPFWAVVATVSAFLTVGSSPSHKPTLPFTPSVAESFTASGAECSAARVTSEASSQPAGSRLPRRPVAGLPVYPERSRGALFLAAETPLEATKTNLLGPFLIATRTRDANSQLTKNKIHPNF